MGTQKKSLGNTALDGLVCPDLAREPSVDDHQPSV